MGGKTKPAVSAPQCHENAKACRDLARRSPNPQHRATLLDIASRWEEIANDTVLIYGDAAFASHAALRTRL
jgi:hypothetical protein